MGPQYKGDLAQILPMELTWTYDPKAAGGSHCAFFVIELVLVLFLLSGSSSSSPAVAAMTAATK